jgi:Holliday junction resolvase-like predicted endonuclease
LGEALARWYLADHDLRVVASNLAIDGGEIDVLAIDHGKRVVVEVRTVTRDGDPIDAVDPSKRRRVSRLAGRVGAGRVDYIGIGITPDAAVFHWVPGRF